MTGSLLFCAFLPLIVAAGLRLTPPAHKTQEVDPSDPEVQACASFALESFNFFSKDPHIYAITKFYSVKRADVGGGQYDMDVEVTKTQWLKDQVSKGSSTDQEVFRCHFVVLSAPWKKQRALLQSSCTPVVSTGAGMH
ncbi:hypothetical protein Z043_112323 [Scleropages formosus]|uniref:Cystatin domain-containing protein n=2 Tax=Scleropages formosus TaxID=113540 RepID=A0A0P7WXP4_SCLFO|nr:hypothetical protein Z043_112323 [Scleropages formosus]